MQYRTTLPPESASVPVARHWTSELARTHGFSMDSVTTLALVVTELTSNAVKHAASEFTVELDLPAPLADTTGPQKFRIAVSDADSRVPKTDAIDEGALGGRGLRLVTSVSEAFGVDSTIDGKTVWVVLLDQAVPDPNSSLPRSIPSPDAEPVTDRSDAPPAQSLVPAQPAHA